MIEALAEHLCHTSLQYWLILTDHLAFLTSQREMRMECRHQSGLAAKAFTLANSLRSLRRAPESRSFLQLAGPWSTTGQSDQFA